MTYSTPDPSVSDVPERSSIGRLFGGRYKVERELGAGALGTVFVARHEQLGRDVALKLMHAALAANPAVVERFEREAQAVAKLRHPNLVTVLDFGVEGDAIYLVTELAEGQTLAEVLALGALPLELAVAIVRQMLRALAYAHAQELLHLDLKPSNVVVRRLTEASVHVVVLDFGIAAILADDRAAIGHRGAVFAPAYAAPEQATGGARPATDVYTLGLLAFEALTGRRPFLGEDRAALAKAHASAPAPMPSSIRAELAAIPGLDAFVLKALEKKPAHRYRDAGQMLEAFDQVFGSASPGEFRTSSASLSLVDITGSFATAEPDRVSSVSPTAKTEVAVTTPVPTTPSTATPRPPTTAPASTSGTRPAEPAKSGTGAFVLATLLFLGVVVGLGYLAISRQLVPASAIPFPVPGLTEEPPPPDTAGTTPLDRGVPDEIAELHDRILAGDKPSRGELQALYRYNTGHPEDARGLLLLGRTATDRRWFSDATEAYAEACRRDPSSAADPRLRRDLIRFAPLERFAAAAADTIDACLGVGAIGEVDEAASTATTPDARQRLMDLSIRLRAAH